MNTIIKHKCPVCGSSIEYDAELQKLKCPFCSTVYELSDFEEKNDEAENEEIKDSAEALTENSAENMYIYHCDSCGGEIVGEKVTGATFCPFCGDHIIVSQEFSGNLKPESIIPFKIDKKSAQKAFKEHIKGKNYVKDEFLNNNWIKKIVGLYVPVWIYDGKVSSDIRYRKIISDSSDSRLKHSRSCSFSVKSLPVDGSVKMNDELMESLEPFDLSQGTDFDMGYLAGYFADSYDMNQEECSVRFKKRAERTAYSLIKGYLGEVNSKELVPDFKKSITQLSDVTEKYVLLPVWILTVSTLEGEKYTFAMNGQTGKFVGNLPLSGKKYKKRVINKLITFIAVLTVIFNLFLIPHLITKGYFVGEGSIIKDLISLLIMNLVPIFFFYVIGGIIIGFKMKKETDSLSTVKYADNLQDYVVNGSVIIKDEETLTDEEA